MEERAFPVFTVNIFTDVDSRLAIGYPDLSLFDPVVYFVDDDLLRLLSGEKYISVTKSCPQGSSSSKMFSAVIEPIAFDYGQHPLIIPFRQVLHLCDPEFQVQLLVYP